MTLNANDHRVLGPALNLFHQQEDAPGTVFWHPNGTTLWNIVENYIRQVISETGYQEVKTPQLVRSDMFEKSGHLSMYRDSMFTWSEFNSTDDNLTNVMKPMNCPCHVQIFNKKVRSYRDLPLRLAEFGSCMRNEDSGSLHGLMRLRAFTQDDAHIFCEKQQVGMECYQFISLVKAVYARFGFKDIGVRLSTRPEKRIGTDEMWADAEINLSEALVEQNMYDVEIGHGEGAFYGPKIEFSIKDSNARAWQLGTLQLDFNLPERLGARYIGKDNAEHIPIMLHRAILGSMERFIAILIEHYNGALPFWLAPVQAQILPISDPYSDYATDVYGKLKHVFKGIRVSMNLENETFNSKIRGAQLMKIPYMIIVGRKEQNCGSVSLRHREKGDLGEMPFDTMVKMMAEDIQH